jgi:hypothetical protein
MKGVSIDEPGDLKKRMTVIRNTKFTLGFRVFGLLLIRSMQHTVAMALATYAKWARPII